MKLEIVFKDGLKETFDRVASFYVTDEHEQKVNFHAYDLQLSERTFNVGNLFEVNPLEIDRSYFETPMSDEKQERTRQIIQEAFSEVDKNPKKYSSPFYTLIPEKNWDGHQTIRNLQIYAKDLGGVMADWVDQALEWAQKIFNGESWENICNNADTANWYRVIIWKNGYARIVGGSLKDDSKFPASDVDKKDYDSNQSISYSVPLIVFNKK